MNAATPHAEKSDVPSLRAVASHARVLVISQIVRRSLRIAILLLAARMLGVAGFGTYILLLTTVEMVAVLSGYGYMDFLTREIAQRPQLAWSLGRRITGLRLAYIVPSLGIALLVLLALRFSSSVIIDTALLGATLVPRAISESAQGVLKGVRRFGPLVWIELVQGAVVLGLVTLFLLRGWGIGGVLIAEILGCVAAAVVAISCVVGWLRFEPTIPAPTLRSLFQSTFAFNVFPFLTNIYDRIDVVLLARLAGSFATGIYSLPYRAFATLQILPYGIMGALLPELSSSQAKHYSIETCARAMRMLLLLSLLVVLTTLTFAGPAVRLLLGSIYSGSVLTIQVLIWAVVPAFLNFALNTFLISAGRERILLRTTATSTVFNIAANCLLIPRYSFLAAAAVTVLTESLLVSQNLWYCYRVAGRGALPRGALTISGFFTLALVISWSLSHVMPEILSGSLSILIFVAFALVNSGLRFQPLAPVPGEQAQ